MNIQQEIINAPGPEPVAYIEHHKGGDNLVWDNPGGKYSVLYTVPPAQSEPVGYLYTNVQSGEYHVSDYDDDYRGPERALWCIEPVYRSTYLLLTPEIAAGLSVEGNDNRRRQQAKALCFC